MDKKVGGQCAVGIVQNNAANYGRRRNLIRPPGSLLQAIHQRAFILISGIDNDSAPFGK